VVEELASEGQCGYPLCKKYLQSEHHDADNDIHHSRRLKPGQKRVDMRRKQVVEVTRLNAMFCSDLCEGAARSFVAQLSTEGIFFRPVARTYLQQQRQQQQQQQLKPLPPTFVYDMVSKAHKGELKKKTKEGGKEEEGGDGTQPAKKEEGDQVKPQERLPIRARRRPLPKKEQSNNNSSSTSTSSSSSNKSVAGEDDRLPLKMGVMERETPPAPQPLSVWVTQGEAIEGHVVSLGVPVRGDADLQEEEEEEEQQQPVEEEEEGEEEEGEEEGEVVVTAAGNEDDDTDERDEAFGTKAARLQDLAEGAPTVVEEDFYMQLWSTLSGWLTPASLQYISLLAQNGGDEKGALKIVHANPTDPLQLQRALLDVQQREGALGCMLVHHVTAAMEAVGLGGRLSPSAGTSRIKGLLSTFDMYRPLPPFLGSRHYMAMAMLFVEALFVSELTAEGRQEEGGEGKKREAYLEKVGLSTAEYTSLRGDLEPPL
jgi:hypothetical protein